jgi:hypothetical protein
VRQTHAVQSGQRQSFLVRLGGLQARDTHLGAVTYRFPTRESVIDAAIRKL